MEDEIIGLETIVDLPCCGWSRFDPMFGYVYLLYCTGRHWQALADTV